MLCLECGASTGGRLPCASCGSTFYGPRATAEGNRAIWTRLKDGELTPDERQFAEALFSEEGPRPELIPGLSSRVSHYQQEIESARTRPQNSQVYEPWANTVIRVTTGILMVPVGIVGLVTTFLGGIIMVLPLVGLIFILALTLIWLPVLGILLGTAWLWHHTPNYVRPLISLVGVPVAIVANLWLTLTPGGGNAEDMVAKHQKQVMCQFWPYAQRVGSQGLIIDLLRVEEGLGFMAAVFRMTAAIAERDSPFARFLG